MLRWLVAACVLLLSFSKNGFAELVRHHEQDFLVYRVDPRTDRIALYWKDPDGQRFGSFRGLHDHLASHSQRLVFAMNAGIFSTEFAPLGLHIEDGRILCPLNLGKGGRGNFFLKPNGIFFIANQKPAIVDARVFPKLKVKPTIATQSGPLLVIKGALHPAFHQDSLNRNIRNGVGVTHDGKVMFAMSQAFVTFYEFATLFRDVLACDDALYLDGSISEIYAPDLGYNFLGGDFAGILAVIVKQAFPANRD